MAFKFQVGTARLSGSTIFEEAVTGLGAVKGNSLRSDTTVSGSGAVQGASVAVDGQVRGGSLRSDTTVSGAAGISGASVTVNGNATLLQNGNVVAAAAVQAGTTVSGSGQLQGASVAVDGESRGGSLRSDTTVSGAAGISGASVTINGNATLLQNGNVVAAAAVQAGTTVSGSGQLQGASVAVDGESRGGSLRSDTTVSGASGISGASVTVNGNATLLQNGNVVAAGAVQAGTTVSGSGQLQGASVAVDGTITSSDTISGSQLQATELTVGPGNVELNVVDANVDQASDRIFFRDGDGRVKKDTIVNFVNAIAGAGTQADSGKITVAGTDAFPLTNGNQNLSGGINFFSGTLAASSILTLPSASDDYKGIQFIVKAAQNCSNTVTVTVTASIQDHARIDGQIGADAKVVLESPGAAVTLVGLGHAHGWAII